MTGQSDTPRFFFRAAGLAVGGRITHPIPAILETQAATSLPPIGGRARATAGRWDHEGIVWFSGAESVATGITDGRTRHTVATAAVDGLNVRGRVTADRVVAGLVSAHTDGAQEVSACPTGSYFNNLIIDGRPVVPKPVIEDLSGWCTVGKLSEACAAAKRTLEDPGGRALDLKPFRPRGSDRSFDDRLLLTYLYENPIYEVPDFGTVYLGELLITRYSRRLTMMRIELGSPVKGELAIASVEGNGHDY